MNEGDEYGMIIMYFMTMKREHRKGKGMFGILLYDILFFAIPIAMILFFGISLYRYCSAVSQNKVNPGTFAPVEIKNRKTCLIVASVIAGVFAMVVLGFAALLFMAVAYM